MSQFGKRHVLLSAPLADDIDGLRKELGIKGVSIVIVKQEEGDAFDQWKTDFLNLGVRNGKGNAVDEKTLFSIGSNSKLFTAIAVGLALREERSAKASMTPNWNTRVKDLVSGFRLRDAVANDQAEIVDLLTHQTGLPLHTHSEVHGPAGNKEESIERLRYLKPSAPFRKRFQYCNSGYLVASTIPEQLLGLPFTQFVQEKVFEPLKLQDTTYDPAWAKSTGRRADGFIRSKTARHGLDLERTNIGWFTTSKITLAGQGGIISSACDMAVWLKCLLLDGRSPITNDIIVPKSIIKDTMTPRVVIPEHADSHSEHLSFLSYGLGQIISSYRGCRIFQHFGNVPGQRSLVLRVPSKRFGLAIMVNDNESGEGFTQPVAYMIIDHLLALPPLEKKARLQEQCQKDVTKGNCQTCVKPASASIALESIQGLYHDQGYGSLTVCAVSSTLPEGFKSLETPSNCRAVLAANPFLLAPESGPTFIASTDKHWSNFLMFQQIEGSIFEVTLNAFYPEYHVDSIEIYGKTRATFTHDGMAWYGNIWGTWPKVLDNGEMTEGGAEVWFERVTEGESARIRTTTDTSSL